MSLFTGALMTEPPTAQPSLPRFRHFVAPHAGVWDASPFETRGLTFEFSGRRRWSAAMKGWARSKAVHRAYVGLASRARRKLYGPPCYEPNPSLQRTTFGGR